MFAELFYQLRQAGVAVSPTAFLTLQRAAGHGLVGSLPDLYVAARAILVKSEDYFDLYDQVFAMVYAGAEPPGNDEEGLALLAGSMVEEWLREPQGLARALGVDPGRLAALTPAALREYFKDRLREQTGRHDGGSRWIGTGGSSPVGHGGVHPGGLRVGGQGVGRSALQLAGERRYRDYAADGALSSATLTGALRRLRHLVPGGRRDRLDLAASVAATVANGGEVELVFCREMVDRLKVILAIDNGGWSMEPYVELVQTLFTSAKRQFREVRPYFFHNTIYDLLWEDPARFRQAVPLSAVAAFDRESCLILVGDASMAPYELMASDGSIYAFERSGRPSIEQLRFLAATFPRAIWLNPLPEELWPQTRTIQLIARIFPMFPFTLAGLERGVAALLQR
jgi:uncharacterized protein